MQINQSTAFRVYSLKAGKKAVFFNTKDRNYIILDGLSAELFEMICLNNGDGLQDWCKQNEISDEDVKEFINQLEKLNIIITQKKYDTSSSADNEATNISEDNNNSQIINLLSEELYENNLFYSFHLDLTNRCNERCIHCYHTFDKYDYSKELSTSDVKNIIDTIYDLGVFSVVLSGGESMLRRDFFEILEYISEKGMLVTLFTNGLLLTEENVRRLSKYRISVISISVYGHTNELHDRITTVNGSLGHTLKGITLLKKYGIQFDLKCVMLSENIAYIDEISSFCKELNFGRECTLDFTLSGKIDGDCSPYEHKISYDCLKKLFRSNPQKYIGNESDYHRSPNEAPCGAGRHGLYCSADGKIYPCVGFRLFLCDFKDLNKVNQNIVLKQWQKTVLADFSDCFKYDYCKYCLEQCAGNNLIENDNYLSSKTSHCDRAKIISELFSDR